MIGRLTLEFPEPTLSEMSQALFREIREKAMEVDAGKYAQTKAAERKQSRGLSRLRALISGGWPIEFEPRRHLGLQTSTRGERRRAQLGRK